MRTWRVGTISMGISIITLGCFLLFSTIKGIQVFDNFTAWWPILFIVLGIEILLYVTFSKKEQPIIKYDIFSIFFIGALGTVGISFYFLLSTGLLEEIRYSIGTTEQTNNIPEVQHDIPDSIKKIVVDTSNTPLTIEGSNINKVHLLGTYEMTMKANEKNKLKQEDFMAIHTVGETMYVTLKPLPVHHKFFASQSRMTATLVLPQNKNVEIRGSERELSLYPGQLQSNWSVQERSNVSVHLVKDSDITLSAVTNQKDSHGNTPWEHVEELTKKVNNSSKENPDSNQQEQWYKNTLKLGNGTHQLNIQKAYNTNISLLEE
ncbi:exosporium protein E [Bacillus pseudomycoides]|uniref:LiaF transmembrane domain-containing protein n=1 Tax=Bacillus pseudomycoides TaxID=64104 RepID=UPI0002DC022B|nr:exosporium protein E [Bacillus pseudomycoides]PDZ11215.1 exosporium protein E [Bacillus pseudomycoides]